MRGKKKCAKLAIFVLRRYIHKLNCRFFCKKWYITTYPITLLQSSKLFFFSKPSNSNPQSPIATNHHQYAWCCHHPNFYRHLTLRPHKVGFLHPPLGGGEVKSSGMGLLEDVKLLFNELSFFGPHQDGDCWCIKLDPNSMIDWVKLKIFNQWYSRYSDSWTFL